MNTTGRPQTVTYPTARSRRTATSTTWATTDSRRSSTSRRAAATVLSQFDYTYDRRREHRYLAAAARGEAEGLRPRVRRAQTSSLSGPEGRLDPADPQELRLRLRPCGEPDGGRSRLDGDDVATYNNRNRAEQQTGGAALPVAGALSEPATVTRQRHARVRERGEPVSPAGTALGPARRTSRWWRRTRAGTRGRTPTR